MELANTIVTLQPGVYILRHPQTGLPPISISRAAGRAEHHGRIEALYTPGTHGGILRDGNDCIVMQVLESPVDLLVTAYLDKVGAAVPSLRLDKVKLDDEASPSNPMTVPSKGLSVIGHVERTGDIVAPSGKVLGIPDANLRLEGFQVMWPDKPDGVDIEYCVRVENAGALPPVHTGRFTGTRNAAARIVGATFKLIGPKATEFVLTGTAFFSGGYKMDLESGAPLAGPTGMEHLTGLVIHVDQVKGNTAAKKGAWDASPRTRIYTQPKTKK